jgi:hypothetical protein
MVRRNWGKADLIKDVVLSNNITLQDDIIKTVYTMTYTGAAIHPYMTQVGGLPGHLTLLLLLALLAAAGCCCCCQSK